MICRYQRSRKMPCIWRDTELRPLDYLACASPLCCHPTKKHTLTQLSQQRKHHKATKKSLLPSFLSFFIWNKSKQEANFLLRLFLLENWLELAAHASDEEYYYFFIIAFFLEGVEGERGLVIKKEEVELHEYQENEKKNGNFLDPPLKNKCFLNFKRAESLDNFFIFWSKTWI